jgi:NADH dehydrogenase
MTEVHRITIVGGGAGGLELATKLGRRLGRRRKAHITLIDAARTHVWKPLLHEVAAGTLDSHEDELEYLAQAYGHHFHFRLGYVDGIDRHRRTVSIAPTCNDEGEEIVPRRNIEYDSLVLAVGSISNDFGIEGVGDHCFFLDSKEQAETFQEHLVESFLYAHSRGGPESESELHVAIVGGGATGVELAAQLYDVTRQFTRYGMDGIDPSRHIRISIIEAAEHILPALPERISDATREELEKLGTQVIEGERVVAVDSGAVRTVQGTIVPAGTKVWAAGIKAPEFLGGIEWLETTPINQVVVNANLQSVSDENVFAMGDCAACPWPGHATNVPPRAQAAHQQASVLVKSLSRRIAGRSLLPYRYRDYGSLVSLGKYSTIGSLMGKLVGDVVIEGYIARLMYLALYKMHQIVLFGTVRVAFLTLANMFRRAVHPRIKLH